MIMVASPSCATLRKSGVKSKSARFGVESGKPIHIIPKAGNVDLNRLELRIGIKKLEYKRSSTVIGDARHTCDRNDKGLSRHILSEVDGKRSRHVKPNTEKDDLMQADECSDSGGSRWRGSGTGSIDPVREEKCKGKKTSICA